MEILHSPSYRTKYLDFLKIDFPRIPFDCSLQVFQTISKIGQDLIDTHLLKKIPDLKIGEPLTDDKEKQNFVMEKVNYNSLRKRLYFNKKQLF